MKRAILLIAFTLLCVGQSFGPKIIKGPLGSYASQPHLNIDLTNGCIAYWDMNENGNITRQDATAYNRDLTDEHGNVNSTIGGVLSQAAYASGGDTSQKLLSSDAAFGGNGTFTIGLWHKVFSSYNFEPAATRYHGAENWGPWTMRLDSSSPTRRFDLTAQATDGTWQTISLGWYTNFADVFTFIIFGYDGDVGKMFVYTNATLLAESAALTGGMTNVAASTLPLAFFNWTGTDLAYNGILDEVGYWDRRLNQNEITALYNGGTGLTYTNFNTKYSPP